MMSYKQASNGQIVMPRYYVNPDRGHGGRVIFGSAMGQTATDAPGILLPLFGIGVGLFALSLVGGRIVEKRRRVLANRRRRRHRRSLRLTSR
jgi:hypothetical protein